MNQEEHGSTNDSNHICDSDFFDRTITLREECVKQADFNEFIEWLAKTQHDELKLLLEVNAKATIGIKAILNQDRELLYQRLESLDNALSAFASGIEAKDFRKSQTV